MIVVDASAVVELLLQSRLAARVHERLGTEARLHVPHLLELEVAQVLRRYVLRGDMTEARAEAALSLLRQFPFERYPHHVFLDRVWALRHNCTAYDAVYVALAETLRAPLLTCDAKLAAAAGGIVEVEVVS